MHYSTQRTVTLRYLRYLRYVTLRYRRNVTLIYAKLMQTYAKFMHKMIL